MTPSALFSVIWALAELSRGHYVPLQYVSIILPSTVLRRLDLALKPT